MQGSGRLLSVYTSYPFPLYITVAKICMTLCLIFVGSRSLRKTCAVRYLQKLSSPIFCSKRNNQGLFGLCLNFTFDFPIQMKKLSIKTEIAYIFLIPYFKLLIERLNVVKIYSVWTQLKRDTKITESSFCLRCGERLLIHVNKWFSNIHLISKCCI